MIQQCRPAVLYLMLWADVLQNHFFKSNVNKFWVVAKPNTNSQIIDILFNADIKRKKRKFKSGLSGREIIGIFITQSEVEKVAKMALIKAVDITKF